MLSLRIIITRVCLKAKTPQDSEEGLLFMQEMVELTKMQIQPETKPQTVTFIKPNVDPPEKVTLLAGPAQFGPELQNFDKITGKVIFTYPPAACTDLLNADRLAGKIVIMDRGNCMFIEKARRIQQAGALAGIVLDNVAGSSAATSPMFAMSGDGKEVDDVTIPVVFLFFTEAAELMKAINAANGDLTVTLGIYSSNEEIQLKAPTDLSLFERLKGSLKSFLSQHVTPQATTIASNLDMMIPVIESQENQEDAIDFHHFHADIVKDSLGGEIRITAASEATIIVLRPVSTPIEILWHQLKEVFVNQIFLNTKQKKGIRIRSFILESYYNWVNKARGVLTKTSLSYKVQWFLSELLVVAPNSSIKKMGQLLEPNRQKLLKQYLLTNMDTMVLNLKTIATKLKNMKSVRPEMEQLLKISESGIAQVENYSFLRHLLADSFDKEDEIVNQHITLLDRIHAEVHTTYQEILIDGVQRYLEKSGVEDSSYYDILIADLQKNLKSMDKGENLLGKTKEDNLVAEFISESNGGKLELESKNIKLLKKSKESSAEKLEDFEYFILTEIEKAVKYSEQNILQKYEGISDESRRNIATESKKDKNVKSDKITLHSSQNQSEGENRKNKVEDTFQEDIDFLRVTKVVNAKLKEATKENKRKKESSADSLSSDIDKIRVSDVSVTYTSDARTAPNKKHTLLQKVTSDVQHSHEIDFRKKSPKKDPVENEIISTDLLEELKNSMWAINEEKILEKKSQITDTLYSTTNVPNEVKYDEKKSTGEDKVKETKPKSCRAKHINDEL